MAGKAECGWCGKTGLTLRKDGSLWRHWDDKRSETCGQGHSCATGEFATIEECPVHKAVREGGADLNAVADALEAAAETLTEPACCDGCEGAEETAPTEADAFLDPTPVAPKREQTSRNGYLAKDPVLGDFRRYKNGNIKPITRVSTFIKAGSDRTALTVWNMRNVLLGAVHFPELAAQAKVLHPNPEGPLPEDKDTKRALDRIVDQLGEKVGSKRAADEGTAVHNSVDRVARGVAGLDDIPTHHVPWVRAFLKCLADLGLELMPDMVERTVFVPQFGGIMGRFDQAVREISTGRVLMADNKTGRLDYSFDEIEGQLALYEAGYRQHGTYVWGEREGDDYWEPPKYELDQNEGIVFHMPVKSGEPSCSAKLADLAVGREHVKLCAKNREKAQNKRKPTPWIPSAPAPVEPDRGCMWSCLVDGVNYPDCPTHGAVPVEPEFIDWSPRFARAQSKEELSGLFKSVTSAGVDPMEIQRLVGIGRERLMWLNHEPPF